MENENLFTRESLYNLVELSLLARMYCDQQQAFLTAHASNEKSSDKQVQKINLQQVLLQMKATENQGHIQVAIAGDSPVGFVWVYEGKQKALVVLPSKQSQKIENLLKASVPQELLN